MKNFFIGLAIVIATTATIGTTYSFEEKLAKNKYIQELRETNHKTIELQNDEKLLSLSEFVCGILDSGQSADDAIFAVVFDQQKRNDSTFIYGAIIVKASVEHFCPEYTYQIEAWVK